MSSFTPEQDLAISVTRRVLAFTSFAFSGAVLVAFFALKMHKNRPLHMPAYVVFSAFILALVDGFSEDMRADGWCELRGVMIQTFDLSLVFWALATAVRLMVVIYKNGSAETKELAGRRVDKVAFFLCWGVSLTFGIISLAAGFFGRAVQNANCWFLDPLNDIWLFFVPMITVFFLMIIVYSAVAYKLLGNYKDVMRSLSKRERKVVSRLLAFPAVFLCVWAFPLLTVFAKQDGPPSFGFIMGMTVSVTCNGIVFSLPYALIIYKKVKKALEAGQNPFSMSRTMESSYSMDDRPSKGKTREASTRGGGVAAATVMQDSKFDGIREIDA